MHRLTFILFCASLFLTLGVGAYVFLYYSMQDQYQALGELRHELAQMMASERSQGARAMLIEQTENDRAELDTFLLSRDNPTPILGTIEQLGTVAGVEVQVESLVEEVNENATSTDDTMNHYLRIALRVRGPWDAVYHMVSMLELIPYVALIEKMAIENESAGEANEWEGQLHLRVLVR